MLSDVFYVPGRNGPVILELIAVQEVREMPPSPISYHEPVLWMMGNVTIIFGEEQVSFPWIKFLDEDCLL